MRREDIDKLLGGYATGTLTPEEREALFAAAIEDQQLFDELAREEPLRALLEDPVAKARLRAGLGRVPAPWYRRWLRPAAWAIPVAAMAAVVVALVVERRTPQQPVTIAEVRQLRREIPAPIPSPIPQTLEKQALPMLPRLANHQPEQTPAPVAAPLSAIPPPPPAAPGTAPVPPPKQPQISEAVALPQHGDAAVLSSAGTQLPVQDARVLFFGSPGPAYQVKVADSEKNRTARPAVGQMFSAAAALTPHLAVRYRLLKKLADSELDAVNPNELLEVADDLVLRLEANERGYISVFERRPDGSWQTISSRAIERLAVQDTPLGDAGEVFVVFARQPQAAPYPVPEIPLDQVQRFYPPEQATYLANTKVPPSQILAFPITVKRK